MQTKAVKIFGVAAESVLFAVCVLCGFFWVPWYIVDGNLVASLCKCAIPFVVWGVACGLLGRRWRAVWWRLNVACLGVLVLFLAGVSLFSEGVLDNSEYLWQDAAEMVIWVFVAVLFVPLAWGLFFGGMWAARRSRGRPLFDAPPKREKLALKVADWLWFPVTVAAAYYFPFQLYHLLGRHVGGHPEWGALYRVLPLEIAPVAAMVLVGGVLAGSLRFSRRRLGWRLALLLAFTVAMLIFSILHIVLRDGEPFPPLAIVAPLLVIGGVTAVFLFGARLARGFGA